MKTLLVLIASAMIQDQSLVGSKHFLVETADKNLADPPVHVHPEHGYRKADADPPVVHPEHGHGHGHRIADAKLRSLLDKTGEDYRKIFRPTQFRRKPRQQMCYRDGRCYWTTNWGRR